MASHPLQVKKRQLRLRDQFYKTSEALHSIFPRPLPGKCRKIIKMRGGASVANYPPHLEPQEVSSPDNTDDFRRGQSELNNGVSSLPSTPPQQVRDRTETDVDQKSVSVDTRLQLLRIMERRGRKTNR